MVVYIVFQVYYTADKDYVPAGSEFDESTQFVNTTNNDTTYTVMGLIPATTYTVSLSAFTGAGDGNMSSSVMGKTIPGKFSSKVRDWLTRYSLLIIVQLVYCM